MFDPTLGKEHNGFYNLYRGLAITPKKGSWKHMRRHIWEIACNRDKRKFNFWVKRSALVVQKPGTPPGVAVILKGKEGAGKGLVYQPLLKMLGVHGQTVNGMERVTGKFNKSLGDTILLFLDEAYVTKSETGALKNLITERTLTIEPKGKDSIVLKNCLHLCMATNNDWVLPMGEDSRRFFINEVDSKYMPVGGRNSPAVCERYFKKIYDEVEGDGTAAMLYDLLRINLKGWNPIFEVFDTSESALQREHSMPLPEKAFMHFLEAGEFAMRGRTGEWAAHAMILKAAMDEQTPQLRQVALHNMAKLYTRYGCEMRHTNKGNLWVFKSLRTVREKWCREHKRDLFTVFPNDYDNDWSCPDVGY